MKQAWVLLESWSEELAVAAIESGADALVLPPGHASKAKSLGRITVIGTDGDLAPGDSLSFEHLESARDEARIRGLLQSGKTVVIGPPPGGASFPPAQNHTVPWEVIPIENLIAAGTGKLIVTATSPGEVELALGVLEKGVAGVVIRSEDPAMVRNLVGKVKKTAEREHLQAARISSITHAGMGDRVCVDTCTLMAPGEGMLVGNSSGFLFLVQAETADNPYVAPRPFRVNAGPVHSYARVPEGGTRYLSELGAGKKVLIFSPDGQSEEATVGRIKVERRPLLLIEAECGEVKGTIILQNAETIRLTRTDGESISVSRLSRGDSVLVATEPAGRHFGMKVEETIREV
ncbi:MAG: 3-dehydroquinate synthase II [Syntrophobacter sp.]